LPRTPAPQTAPQQQQDVLQVQKLQTDLSNAPLERESKQVGIEQNRQSMQNQRFNQNQGLRQEYNALPLTKNYQTVVQKMGSALNAPPGPQGDLDVLYAFATVMDPNSVVRESEQDMAKQTASLYQQLQQKYRSYLEGNGLPPEVRQGLIETMRHNTAVINNAYNQQRVQYEDLAKRNGFDPVEIVGPHLGSTMRPLEETYIREHGGTPRDPNAPLQVSPSGQQTEAGFGLQQDPRNTSLTPEQATAYDAWWKAHPNPTPEQLQAFGTSLGLNIPADSAAAIVQAAKQGRGISHDVQVKPDISDAPQGVGPSIVRGAADTATLGLRDKIVAAGDTITRGGTYDQNLARQYAISDRDQQDHPVARLGGQILGGFALPMGEVNSVGNAMLKGGAYGTAYGIGSSRQLSDVPANALAGGVTGAVVPGILGKVFKHKAPAGVDPLVDPVTGELNQPMQSMNPAQRLAVMNDFGLKTVTPGMVGGRTARVLEQGLNNVPGSAGVMEDVNQAASGELRRAMQGVAQQFGQSKTLNEGGAQLQAGAQQYIERGKSATAKAYQAIPISDQAQASNSATVATLQNLTSRFQSNPDLAEALKDPKLATYLNAAQKGMSWKDLKDFRSIIGEKIGDARFGESSSTSDLRALYGALSQDMQNTAAANGPKAVAAFNRANNLYRQQQQLIQGSLTRILGKNGQMTPEQATAAVQAMTRGGNQGGDLKTLAQIKAATVKSGAWDEIASTLIHLGGQPAKSEGRAFNPQTFVNWYADMSEQARAMLFKPELRRSLDGFVSVVQQLGRVKGLTNTSNTTPTMIGSGVIAAGGLAAISHPMALLGLAAAGGANYGMAKLWTNPGFVRLMTGLGKASLSQNTNAVQSQVGRLAKFAAQNPEFSEPVQHILRQIANDNFVGRIAASGGGANAQEKQQQQ
jgi:hypothetical protein